MGMTIDKSLKILEKYYHFHWEYDCGDYGGLGSDEAEAIKYAVDTMHKYQKIQEIVEAWNDMNSFDSMKQISEVLEDGRN